MKKVDINKFIKENSSLTYRELSQSTGLSVDAVRKRYNKLGLPPKRVTVQNAPKKPEDAVVHDTIVHNIKKSKKETDKKYKVLLDEIDRTKKELHASISIGEHIDTFSISPKFDSNTSEATAFLVASDWHIEERVKPQTVNGLNSYDLNIAKACAVKFFQNGLGLVKIFQKDVHIDTIVLPLLGDFISGSIHDELLESNQLSPIDATILAQTLIASGIEFLLKDKSIKKIIIPCHSGNHARITAKTRHSTEAGNSLEYFMYCQLANHFKKEKRVQFMVSEGYHSYLDVYGYTIRFHHGHAIRYGGGIGGITIPVNKAIAQWDKLKQADLDVFGHYHQLFDGGKFISNGSMVGYNAFALSIKAGYEPRKQACFLIDKKRGKTFNAPILF